MTHLAAKLLRRLAGLAAALIIIAGALSLALRIALPQADGLRQLAADGLGDYLGAELHVGQLGLRLRGLEPELTLDDAVLRDPHSGDRLLALRRLRVDLNLRASLLAAAPRIDGVTLVGARIEVLRGSDGRIAVRGLDRVDAGDGGAARFFLREGRFSLAESLVYYTDAYAGVPTLGFRVHRLDLVNRGRAHRLRVTAAPPGDPAGALTLLAELEGPAAKPETWSGRLYADWQGSDLARPLRGRMPGHLRLATDGLHLTSWNRLADGRITRSVNRVWLDDLVLRRADAGAGPPPLDLGDLGGIFRWQSDAGGWRLDAPQVRLFGSLLGAEKVALRLRRDGEHALAAWLSGLPLARLADIARFAVPPAALAELPAVLRGQLDGRIAGRLSNLQVRIRLPDGAAGADRGALEPLWFVQGELQDLGVGPQRALADTSPPAGPIPALDGLDLRFSVSPTAGAVSLDTRDLHLDLRPHLIEPLTLTRLAGLLQWRVQKGGGLDLWSDALAADTKDVESLSRLALALGPPHRGPFLDLHTHFRGGDAEAMPRYLPASRMDDKLEDWLARAIVAGRLESGDLLLRGDLSRFPFDAHDGRFQLALRLVDGVFDYAPPPAGPDQAESGMRAQADAGAEAEVDWPWLRDMAATLVFDQRSLSIDVADARLLDVAVTGQARLPNLWRPEVMSIDAVGRGPLADGLAVLAETPLARQLAGVPRALDAEGTGELELALQVPLRRGLAFDYEGRLEFGDDAIVTLQPANLALNDIDGELAFDDGGVRADGIDARVGEQPVALDIATLPRPRDAAGGGVTEVQVRGETAVSQLAEQLSSPWWALGDGRFGWTLVARLDNADAVEAPPPLALRFTADLTGVALDLPAPLGKQAGTPLPLSAETRWVPRQPFEVSLRAGDFGALAELHQGPEGIAPERIAVDFNELPEALPPESGIAVRADFDRLDLDAWLAWRRNHAALFPGYDVPTMLPLQPVRLSADSLTIGPLSFERLAAVLEPRADGGWRIAIDAAGNSGTMRLPGRDGGRLVVRLDNLDIAPLLAAPRDPSARRGMADPRTLPSLSVQIDALRRGPDALGRFRVDAERIATGLRATELSLIGPLVSAEGTGTWTRDATDFTQTEIAVDLRSDDLGELLRNAGYYNALSGAPSEASLALAWPGGPGTFALSRARGAFSVDIGAGRMLEVEPGVGRMLGVLNLAAIERRLSLDFSDVLETGFAFDAIRGKLTIGNGQARISQLDILASTADIRVRGMTDLVDETFDQTLRVTPKIGTGVAIAGAVAGGPLVGAAVLLADKLSGDAVDRLVSYEYRVTGPWSAPRIRRVAGSGAPRSVPDLLLPEQATGRAAPGTVSPEVELPRRGAPARQPEAIQGKPSLPSPDADSERPVSPFLEPY
jgi:uncharacterized protein (TIGR02099 family)